MLYATYISFNVFFTYMHASWSSNQRKNSIEKYRANSFMNIDV